MTQGQTAADTTGINPRIDPVHDKRRLVLYFGGLIVFYAAVVLAAQPKWGGGEDELNRFATGVMFAPAVGAVLAAVFGPGAIRLGKLTWWILAAYIPTAVILAVTFIFSAAGTVTFDHSRLVTTIAIMVPAGVIGGLSAFGEEIGWRGFLWPLLRRRMSFLRAAGVMWAVWLGYHVPLVVAGLYGSVSGLPAFAVAIAGFVLFVGVLTERSRSIWPSIVCHGSWNSLVATKFAWNGADDNQLFSGNDTVLGEFGWIAAVTMLAVGALATWWHFRTPTKDNLSSSLPTGYESPIMWLTFRSKPKEVA